MYAALFLIFFVSMIACHYIAKLKGLNPVAWGLTGAFIGPLAIPILLLLKNRKSQPY
ncbi:MAG: hypothetical protein OEZ39_15570 [Gammaproteobacteria bacterium]|nr:hypothetical protein [Gammaproteobacteria bacterium]MDH5653275.1 hypothetical protein [Gammaproteobacteria bacterium]